MERLGNKSLSKALEGRLGSLEYRTLSSLKRICGPESSMAWPETERVFYTRVAKRRREIEQGKSPAPLIISEDGNVWDGNHTLEALRELGKKKFWCLTYEPEVKIGPEERFLQWVKIILLIVEVILLGVIAWKV